MRVFDVHAHWGHFPMPMKTPTLTNLLRVMDTNRIERIVVSSIEAILYDMVCGNQAVANLVRQSTRIYGYIFLNPNQVAQSFAEIERYAGNPRFLGVKLYSGSYIGQPLNCAAHKRFLERIVVKHPRLVVLFHCGENDPSNFPGIVEVARQFPTLKFIAGHMGSALWPQALAVIQAQRNIFAEISAPVPARTRIEDAVKALGPDRVLFGSDYPIINPAYMLGAVQGAEITSACRRKILYENAVSLFG